MAQVDPDDDGIRRFVVRHYRYDPERRERRHVVVAAFDNEPEFRAGLDRVQEEIEGRRNRGELVDRREHATGSVLEPGYRRRTAAHRQILRAIRRGVSPPLPAELPGNVTVFRAIKETGQDGR